MAAAAVCVAAHKAWDSEPILCRVLGRVVLLTVALDYWKCARDGNCKEFCDIENELMALNHDPLNPLLKVHPQPKP